MKKIIYLLAIGTYALFLTGCYTLDDDNFEPQTITPVLIAKGENCFAESLAGTNMVIKTDEAWNALLDAMSSVTNSFAETEIDFSHYMVLAVFEEVKGIGGWSIDITGVTEHASKIVVAYTNLETGDATEAISQPYHIVRIPKSGKSVLFERTGGEDEGEYPIEIPFEDYSLEGTSCQWNYHSGAKQVIIINSNEELKNYIECTEDSYPEIDFSTNTLLLARSGSKRGIHHIDIDFIKNAANEYTLNAAVYMLMTMEAPQWTRGIIVPKMDNETKITFNETYTNYTGEEPDYPIEIPFEKYSLEGTDCMWLNFESDSVIIINSNEELGNYINCPADSYPEIDFSENTLLLVKGTSGDVREVSIAFFQNSNNQYTLKVTIHLGIAGVSLPWNVEILVPEISNEAIVTLEKQEIFY